MGVEKLLSGVTHLRLGTLDSDADVHPLCNVFVGSKAQWHAICDGLPQFAGEVPLSQVPPKVLAYAQNQAHVLGQKARQALACLGDAAGLLTRCNRRELEAALGFADLGALSRADGDGEGFDYLRVSNGELVGSVRKPEAGEVEYRVQAALCT